MIFFRKEKNPIYFGVIRSKVKVTVTKNIIFDNRNILFIVMVILNFDLMTPK
jgi:hypothetical protein